MAAGVANGSADLANPALTKVLAFRDGGPPLILNVPEPLAVTIASDGRCFVREGTHRSIAFALIGQETLTAIDFESATLL